ncbi:MAG: PhnD/SsuA/transferrin family substrate-binding protein [Candidatus Kariarchaeaceae archaeon]|jgi:phosphonate transport system substrate-binding protein
MTENGYVLQSRTLLLIIVGSIITGLIIGGFIGFAAAPDGGENFDLPPKDVFVMGFIPTTPENADTVTTNAQPLVDFLSAQMGIDVEIYPVTNGYETMITAFELGQVDAAILDGTPSHFVVESGNAEVVLAELRSANNAPFYNAAAWVRANSSIDSVETMLNGNYVSSHTSATGTAGMVMPLGTLIDEGYMDATGIESTDELLAKYFANSTIGGSYGGALQRVLDGQADVAFVRDTTPLDLFPDRADELRLLYTFGKVPSHPVVVSTELADGWKFKFVEAMLSLNDPANAEIVDNLYGAPGLVGANNLHLRDVSAAVSKLPWLEETILGDRD